MVNVKLIEHQPHWRVALIHIVAKIIGVAVHVEGLPFGSWRNVQRQRAVSCSGSAGSIC